MTAKETLTQVDFYVMEEAQLEEAERFLCRLCEKAVRMGQRVCIVAESAQLDRLDEMLWTFRPESFITHKRLIEALTEPEKKRISVLLTEALTNLSGCDVVVNLLPAIPATTAGEPRVVELVYDDIASRSASRDRFREYRALGLSPGTIQIDARF